MVEVFRVYGSVAIAEGVAALAGMWGWGVLEVDVGPEVVGCDVGFLRWGGEAVGVLEEGDVVCQHLRRLPKQVPRK